MDAFETGLSGVPACGNEHRASQRCIPEGLVVELSRSKILPGKEREADRWMAMVNERYDECIESLDRERMAVECAFRFREEGPEYIYWMSIYGEDGSGLDLTNPLDRDLQDQATLCKEPGWADAEPQFLLLPEPVKRALLAWALRQAPGSTTSAPPSTG